MSSISFVVPSLEVSNLKQMTWILSVLLLYRMFPTYSLFIPTSIEVTKFYENNPNRQNKTSLCCESIIFLSNIQLIQIDFPYSAKQLQVEVIFKHCFYTMYQLVVHSKNCASCQLQKVQLMMEITELIHPMSPQLLNMLQRFVYPLLHCTLYLHHIRL